MTEDISSETVLVEVQKLLDNLVDEFWAQNAQADGEKVQMYRDYMDGKHRLELVENMADLLRIEKEEDERFSLNYARLVVSKKSDRLRVLRIDAILPMDDRGDADAVAAANEWTSEVLAANRFDALQGNIHRSVTGDGTTYLVVDPEPLNDGGHTAGMVHEPAYDGYVGMIPVWDEENRNKLAAAVKIWWSNVMRGFRFNIIYDDRIERYFMAGALQYVDNEGMLHDTQPSEELWPIAWSDDDGSPIGVLAIPFTNQNETWRNGGRSEMADALPSNDVLNRSFMSMSMAAEYTGFQTKFAKGFPAPEQTGPGAIIEVYQESEDSEGNTVAEIGIPKEREVSLEAIEAGSVGSLIDACNFSIDQIGSVTETPLPAKSDTQSGEALKQREAGLVSKVVAAQPGLGNSWEDAMAMMHKVQTVFGQKKPPDILRFDSIWKEAETRSDAQVLANAKEVREQVPKREYLELVSPVTGWSKQKVDTLIEEIEAETQQNLLNITRNMPTLG